MAEENDETRTEEPTPRRREEARQRGQIPFSQELTAATVVLIGAIALTVMGPALGSRLMSAFRADLARLPSGEFDIGEAQLLAIKTFGEFAAILATFLGVLVSVAIGVNVAQVGFRILPDRLTPNFERVNPIAGFQRMFSTQSAWRALLAMLKVSVLLAVSWLTIRNRTGMLASIGDSSLTEAVGMGWGICARVLVYLAAVLALLGAIDYLVQWRRIEAALKMTKQELKEEMKREEGDPLIRNRIRQLQRERARQRMRNNVPKATVVITNPTHLAIAIRYDRGSSRAPVVVAKGAGVFAKQIAELARRHSIPVLERPIVARAIYATVKEGQEIPPELFRAVAEVIAFVFRLRGIAA